MWIILAYTIKLLVYKPKQKYIHYGAPRGNRIPVLALKGLCPCPLDDGGKMVSRVGIEPTTLRLKVWRSA